MGRPVFKKQAEMGAFTRRWRRSRPRGEERRIESQSIRQDRTSGRISSVKCGGGNKKFDSSEHKICS